MICFLKFLNNPCCFRNIFLQIAINGEHLNGPVSATLYFQIYVATCGWPGVTTVDHG